MIKQRIFSATVVLLVAFGASADDLGNVSFPNSGAPEAQDAFLTGVKALHSFQFDEAGFAFAEAREIDPDFALAYWGEAMSKNKPLWAMQDVEAATEILNSLAPTLEGRLARAPMDKEKAFLTAVDMLYYSADDKLERDNNYADYMAQMRERWPEDHEIAIFRSLSLLGTMRPGDRGFRRQAQAAAIALEVFDENPNHPGAAHFIIHSFDDPDHAILALPAARVYADIAPAAAHALHMPSHIFLQLGMWDRVRLSNIEAYEAAVATNERYGLPEGREDFHTLSWLSYANLMLGHYDRSADGVALARAAVDRNPGAERVLQGYLNMRGRYILETDDWQDLELPAADSPEGQHANWVAAVGMNAAHTGDFDTAKAAEARLLDLEGEAAAEGKTYDAHMMGILMNQVAAVRFMKQGDHDRAVEAARQAAADEVRYMRVPSGPPIPIKPAVELYAGVLLAAGNADEAMAAYKRSLEWIPQRTPSMLGLATAALRIGDQETAREMYSALRSMPGANPNGPAVQAATNAVAAAN